MSAKYLKYLFKKYIPVITLFLILSVALVAGYILLEKNTQPNPTYSYSYYNGETIYEASFTICKLIGIAMCYAIPIPVLSFINNRRKIDTLLSLPVSRGGILGASVLFSVVSAYAFFLFTSTAVYILIGKHYLTGGGFVKLLLCTFLAMTALILFNSVIFLIGNNALDGIILLGAYTLLPLMLYLVTDALLTATLAGYAYGFLVFNMVFICLSPAYSLINLTSAIYLSSDYQDAMFDSRAFLIYVVVLVLYVIVFGVLLYFSFVKRKAERAGQITNGFWGYKFIIPAYLFLCQIFAATCAVEECAILNILLLFVFVTAGFVYTRKIRLSFKPFIVFAVSLALSIGIVALLFATEFLGLARNIKISGDVVNYTLQGYVIGSDDNIEYSYIAKESEMPAEQKEYIDKLINMSIDNFYAGEDDWTGCSVEIRYGRANGYWDGMTFTEDNRLQYKLPVSTVDDVATLASHLPLEIYTYNNETEVVEYDLSE